MEVNNGNMGGGALSRGLGHAAVSKLQPAPAVARPEVSAPKVQTEVRQPVPVKAGA